MRIRGITFALGVIFIAGVVFSALIIQKKEKGSPYDNAVAEAMFKVIKTEFINGTYFDSQEKLDLELFDYINWYNNIRIHGTLGYLSPLEYKSMYLKKVV